MDLSNPLVLSLCLMYFSFGEVATGQLVRRRRRESQERYDRRQAEELTSALRSLYGPTYLEALEMIETRVGYTLMDVELGMFYFHPGFRLARAN